MSEVARLRLAIEAECESIQRAMHGFCTSASHDIINNKYNGIGGYMDELKMIIGEQEAGRIVVETYIQIVEGHKER